MVTIQMFIRNYRLLAEKLDCQIVAKNLEHIETKPPETFFQAAQLLFTCHNVLHLLGEPTAIGRFDVLLAKFDHDRKIGFTRQDIVEAFFLKMGERVQVNRHLINDMTEWGMTAVPWCSNGAFAGGDAINQWVQQVTVGGVTRDGELHYTPVTTMCIKAIRRLPLNAPCVSLRLAPGVEKFDELLSETAKAILSGGAHPIIFNDQRIVRGLEAAVPGSPTKPDIATEDARDYACDGCYEPMIAGKSEFAFGYVPLLQVLEYALNQGRSLSSVGPLYKSGMVGNRVSTHTNIRIIHTRIQYQHYALTQHPHHPTVLPQVQSPSSKPASEITDFEDLKRVFAKHLEFFVINKLSWMLGNYGNVATACPSPILSTLMGGCLERGRDIYNGGSLYHFLGMEYITFANTVDSLYVIRKMCFGHTEKVKLPEMVTCLATNWGKDIRDPVVDVDDLPERFAKLQASSLIALHSSSYSILLLAL